MNKELELKNKEYIEEMKKSERFIIANQIYTDWKNTSQEYCMKKLSKHEKVKNDEEIKEIIKIINENYIDDMIDGEYYGNYVKIIDINGEIYTDYFEDYCGNEWFTVIDTQKLGENIGRTIIDDLDKNKIIGADGNYTSKFFGEILTKIEKEVTNELRNEICTYLFEYLDNNLE